MIESLAAIILAAGASERMPGRNKLLLPLGRSTVVRETVRTALEAGVGSVVVVTGWNAESVVRELEDLPVRTIDNRNHAQGMGTSIACGIDAASRAAGYLIWPGDMPFISPETPHALAAVASPDVVVVPTHLGRRGHPVLFGGTFRMDLAALKGDRGARGVLRQYVQQVREVPVEDPGVHADIDTMPGYRNLLTRYRPEDL